MTITTVYSTNDGYLRGRSTTYSLARAGTDIQDGGTDFVFVGQRINAGEYQVYENFFNFDTSSLPDTDSVTDVDFMVYGSADQSTVDFIAEAREYDYGSGTPAVADGDFIPGANLGSYTLLATWDSTTYTSGYNTFTENGSAFRSAINKTGNTRLMIASDRLRNNITSTTVERALFVSSIGGGGTSTDPKLVITHSADVLSGALEASAATAAAVTATHTALASAAASATAAAAVSATHTAYSGSLGASAVAGAAVVAVATAFSGGLAGEATGLIDVAGVATVFSGALSAAATVSADVTATVAEAFSGAVSAEATASVETSASHEAVISVALTAVSAIAVDATHQAFSGTLLASAALAVNASAEMEDRPGVVRYAESQPHIVRSALSQPQRVRQNDTLLHTVTVLERPLNV